MKSQRALVTLTVINLALLLFTLTQQIRPAHADTPARMLRGTGLEIVDAQGRVRASITVMPEGKSQNGVAYPETVLLRLITERGRPSPPAKTRTSSLRRDRARPWPPSSGHSTS